ncbi:uncharacterized protein N0V89_000361 [Didymosphaeria variabile]|uniref:CENP-V/GFA domain-containing protein n=1 Tax=Didymosphaeria variabile TaxID=1932322 RepID=A0A9W8XWJ9_9PLEO|nr:uncharacterized protein N0V89_000361 [Didymosphaeria variabile]KAJ4359805.1 hypothetical protein N0V89_000361 [Didymosphaeria variabile]
MAHQGGCMCGNVRYSVEGEPAGKITGSTYSTNAIFPSNQFKLTQGTPKQHSKTADSGKTITSHFCGDCGSTLFRETGSFEGAKIVKIGTLDDANALSDLKPAIELFAPTRIPWVQAVAGAQQKDTM